jgi:hypothetical protein
MTSGERKTERRLQIAGTLLICGLLIEAICLLWARPIAFVIFAGAGGCLLLAGMVVYLFCLVPVDKDFT